MTMSLDVLTDAARGANLKRRERLLDGPTVATVQAVHSSGGLMVTLAGHGDALHGPCYWQKPLISTESADSHSHDIDQETPPQGVTALVLEAVDGSLWVTCFSGWPR